MTMWTEYSTKDNYGAEGTTGLTAESPHAVYCVYNKVGGIEYALPCDFSSFLLPPQEKNRCVGSSKAAADCVCNFISPVLLKIYTK